VINSKSLAGRSGKRQKCTGNWRLAMLWRRMFSDWYHITFKLALTSTSLWPHLSREKVGGIEAFAIEEGNDSIDVR